MHRWQEKPFDLENRCDDRRAASDEPKALEERQKEGDNHMAFSKSSICCNFNNKIVGNSNENETMGAS
eukprot:CAMPEP_0172419264 /NCGR_PEP_ID=MMETSP1064-20121228/5702_1 /TAXON_ID=202472 /ORGANISM="Aulacoseira subarctica , Strain CCAP 1002/5" /LENGTH=67 /DNA_ID=CAMNT_0013158661 /DNA_START=1671 /DNA_END=1871 /DNA_ORIENTATION=+